ncbi:MAG: hypothetical protein ABI222_00010 [Opitutaceae bacterium]
MSLINEALKKAQHQRTGGPADAPPMPGGGSGGHRGNSGAPKGLLILLIAAAFVVIVLSVVATVYFVNRTPAAASAATVIASAPEGTVTLPQAVVAVPAPTPALSPVIISPVIVPIPATAPSLPAAAAVETATANPAVSTKAESTTPSPAEPVVAGSVADRINDYLDKLHVTGVRMSENGVSKVLMNDRVYRVNDVVSRVLGLKLTRIAADSLTFVDATGATYVKSLQ